MADFWNSKVKGKKVKSDKNTEKKVPKRKEPKFNKEKCYFCKYHGNAPYGYMVGYYDTKNCKSPIHVYCNYSACGETCLKRGKNGSLIDIRGEDFENCKLYEDDPKYATEKQHKLANKYFAAAKRGKERRSKDARGKEIHVEQ